MQNTSLMSPYFDAQWSLELKSLQTLTISDYLELQNVSYGVSAGSAIRRVNPF
jgi:hypothetical protein